MSTRVGGGGVLRLCLVLVLPKVAKVLAGGFEVLLKFGYEHCETRLYSGKNGRLERKKGWALSCFNPTIMFVVMRHYVLTASTVRK